MFLKKLYLCTVKSMYNKANSWLPARIPKLTERRQMLKERQSQIFEVGIEFSVT